MVGDLQEGANQREQAGLFAATRWSVVIQARENSEVALATLCQSYRQPLIVWLRSRGYTPHDAEDMIHSFLAHSLGRRFLNNVAMEKGRFRTFLLKYLKNYISDQRERICAVKRGGREVLESLDDTTDDGRKPLDAADRGATPEVEYDRAWACTVLANALRRLEEECAAQGHQALCSRLQPVMFADDGAGSYQEIGKELGVSAGAVNVAAHRIRVRLRWLIRDEVLQTIANERELEEEVRYMIQLFSRGSV